jgi:hypothetical protein
MTRQFGLPRERICPRDKNSRAACELRSKADF